MMPVKATAPFELCGWDNLAAGPPGSTPAGLDRGAQTARPCVQRRGPRWQAPLHIARLNRRAIALTPKAVRLRHFARVAQWVRSARMLVTQEDRKLRSYGFTVRRHPEIDEVAY